MNEYTISRHTSGRLYAYSKGRFWRWDEAQGIWRESHLMHQKYVRSQNDGDTMDPQDFLNTPEVFEPLDEYEIPCGCIDALKNAKPCKNAPVDPVEEESEWDTAPNAAVAEQFGNSEQLSEPSPSPAPSFDFGADDQTNALLLQDAQTFITGNMARIMAAKHAHDLTANHYMGSWGKWCAAVGISRDTGDRMVSVAAQCGNIQLEGKSILDVQPLKLLYAAAKPSTPEAVKQAVFSGDITTYKEYQDVMAQLKAEKERADTAERQLEATQADVAGLKERADSAEAREEEAWKMQSKSEQRAKEAEKQLEGSRQVAEAAKRRADKWQAEAEALKKQPITVVVDEEEVDKRAGEKAYQMASDMTAELKAKLEQATADSEQDARNAYDGLLLAGRTITNAWQMAKPLFAKLPEDQRDTAANQLVRTLSTIQGEVSKCL